MDSAYFNVVQLLFLIFYRRDRKYRSKNGVLFSSGSYCEISQAADFGEAAIVNFVEMRPNPRNFQKCWGRLFHFGDFSKVTSSGWLDCQ